MEEGHKGIVVAGLNNVNAAVASLLRSDIALLFYGCGLILIEIRVPGWAFHALVLGTLILGALIVILIEICSVLVTAENHSVFL